MFKLKYLIVILGFGLFISCATFEAQYRDKDAKPIYPIDKEIEKTFYLVGDAGLSPLDGKSIALTAFENFLETQKTTDNYTIFLGDNIYPDGMPPLGDSYRKAAEHMMDAQYDAAKKYGGTVYFIPGNHEYYQNGASGVKLEEEYINQYAGKTVFEPQNGCPLKSISVSDDIQLILLDTQWFLENWNDNPRINEFCDIKTREKLFIEIKIELENNRNKTIVFSMHHPMFTNGNHGGYFALEKHLYPTQKNIPLPILSSLVAQIRSQGGVSVQDRYNELYNELMTNLRDLAKNNDRIIFTSGHEHTLQYIENEEVKQIVSGSGAKQSYAALGKYGLFSDGRQGFAVLDVFKDGSSWVRYYGGDANLQPELLFQKQVIPPTKEYKFLSINKNLPANIKVPIFKQDSINEALFFNTVWGSKYKEDYATPVNSKVASLDTLFGGLTVLREDAEKGYKSLLLKDSIGNTYRMRAMAKNALSLSKVVSFDIEAADQKSIEESKISKDAFNNEFYTASHPYAVLAIPTMAKAIDIFYTTPQVFYVPKQAGLQKYNENFGDELYLISVEPSENSEGEQTFKYPDDVKTTDDILTKIREGGEIFLDEDNYIRSRLFDMLIGDWDREEDHWRWAEYYNKYSKNVYVPIPKNRDDAFSSIDGNILNIASTIFSGNRQNHIYGDNLNDLKWFNEEGVILDRALLERSGRNNWLQAAKNIEKSLTDAVIDSAFSIIPSEVNSESLKSIISTLKNRRKNLSEIADRYYTYLAKQQNLVGTDGDDVFKITRLPNGETNVKMYSTINGKLTDTIIDRTYKQEDTKELWIYGLNGEDTFQVDNEEQNLMYIRGIGGHGLDKYILNEGRRVKIYDHESFPSVIENKRGGSLRFTDVYNLNTYDYRKQIDRSNIIASAIGYNPDDGFRVGLQYIYEINNFQRNPFSQKHIITGGYYANTFTFDLQYDGEFANIKDGLNLSLGAKATSPNFVNNFFGIGNETPNFDDQLGYDFNRVGVQTLGLNVGLVRNSAFGSVFKVQTKFEAITATGLESDFLETINFIEVDKTNYFGTLEGIYSYRSSDNIANPTLGMMFDLNLGIKDNFRESERLFGYLKTRLGFYNVLEKSRHLVLKTNLKYQTNLGERYEFYQAVNLGGESGLRGFREERFSGKSSLVASGDLRYGFDEFKIGLFPIQIGVYGGADLGRVWIKDDDSEQWHNSYGGGLWINGAGGLNATFSTFASKEDVRFTFGLGFNF